MDTLRNEDIDSGDWAGGNLISDIDTFNGHSGVPMQLHHKVDKIVNSVAVIAPRSLVQWTVWLYYILMCPQIKLLHKLEARRKPRWPLLDGVRQSPRSRHSSLFQKSQDSPERVCPFRFVQ